MTAKDYPVTELYGCQPGYPLNQNLCPPGQGFHNGIDYGCPVGTPVVVNGVTIGLSGATGAVTGPHVHVGRWINGQSTDPGVGNGWKFNSAVVTEINEDPTNGKYVRVQADGASWVYLHMSNNQLVSVGQVLQGEDMTNFTKAQINVLAEIAWNREAHDDEKAVYETEPADGVLLKFLNSTTNVDIRTKAAQFDNFYNALQQAYQQIEKLKKEVDGASATKLAALQTDIQTALDKSKG